MRYEAHETLVAPARPTAQLWRLALGLGIATSLFYALSYSYFNVIAGLVTMAEWPYLAREIETGSTPRGMLSVLGIFALLIFSLMLVINQLHGRKMRALLGPPGIAARQFFRVSVALSALGILLWLLPEPATMTPQPGLPFLRWVALLPLALPLLFLQVSAEELVFRGYIQSQLAGWVNHPVIWMFFPAMAFGLLHYDPAAAGENAPFVALSAFVFGLAAADLTARAGTLGPVLALHFAINISALVITAPQNQNFGLALYRFPYALDDVQARAVWLPYDTLIMLCAWLTARLAIRK